nr:WAT1-related protein At2g39510-like [Ipomoea batatas]
MTRENLVKSLNLVRPYLAVILLQFGSAGMGIIAKSALNHGMSPFTYAVYRSFFAAAFLAPFALAFERFSWNSSPLICHLSYPIGLPLIIFENMAKDDCSHFLEDSGPCFIRANTLKSYPAGLSLTCLICTVGALQASVVALVAERGNPAAWALHWDIKLLAYVYSGVIGSGVAYYLSGVIMKEKGPVFVTAFNPLNMIIVAILGSFMLAEQLDFGKALGAGVIVIGLYMVLWGKKQDQDSLELINDKIAPADKSPSTLVKFPTKQEPIDTPKTIAGDDEVV